jgi:hypothetical protein
MRAGVGVDSRLRVESGVRLSRRVLRGNKTYFMSWLCYKNGICNRLRALAETANGQEGYIMRAQARALVTDTSLRRVVNDGRLVSPARGVYRFAASPEHPHEALYAAWLLLDPEHTSGERLSDPDALVFNRSALEVLDLGDFPAHHHTFAVKVSRRLRRREITFRVRQWGPGDWLQAEGMPVARPAWVVAEMFAEGADLEHMRMIIDDASRNRLDTGDLHARLVQLGRRGSRALEMLG